MHLYNALWEDAKDKCIIEQIRLSYKVSELCYIWGPYSTLKKKLDDEKDVKKNKETIAHFKAYIKKRNSPLWAWAVICAMTSILVDILTSKSPHGKTLLFCLNYDARLFIAAIIIIVCLVCLFLRIRASEKNEYLLSIVESVESDYKEEHNLLDDKDLHKKDDENIQQIR